jgi:hypothetical protein
MTSLHLSVAARVAVSVRACLCVGGDEGECEGGAVSRHITTRPITSLILLHFWSYCITAGACVTHSCVVQTLENLRVLRLDNNKIQRIENISHLVNLEWLGASRVYR